MLREVRAGDHPSAQQWNELIRTLKAMGITGAGTSNIGGSQQIVDRAEKQPAKFAFVVGVNSVTGMVITRDATWLPGDGFGWMISSGAENAIEKPPGPGLTIDDFVPFIARNNPPQLTDPVIQLIDDACWLPSKGGSGVWLGKIVQVNLPAQLAFVARIKPGVDPTSELLWANEVRLDPLWDSNFNAEDGACCWIMGYSGYLKNQPVVVVDGGSVFPWAVNAWNLTGPEFVAFCEPDGPFAPQRELNCEPPPEVPVCEVGACCRQLMTTEGHPSGPGIPFRECSMITAAACATLGPEGDFHPGKTCHGHTDDDGHFIPGIIEQGLCDALRPCCLPDGSCVDAMRSRCDALGGVHQPAEDLPCSHFDCEQPVLCCFPDGSCNEEMPGACAAAGGTPVSSCTACISEPRICCHSWWFQGEDTVHDCVARSCAQVEFCTFNPSQCDEQNVPCSQVGQCP